MAAGLGGGSRPAAAAAAAVAGGLPSALAAAIVGYFVSGIALTLFNKWLLSEKGYNFRFPIFCIMLHTSVNSGLARLLIRAVPGLALTPEGREHPLSFRKLDWSTYFRSLFPVGGLLGFDYALSNWSLEFITVSFMEVCKAGVPLILLVWSRHQQSSWSRTATVVLLTAGIVLTAYTELEFHLLGFVLACASTLCGASKLLLMETLLSSRSAESFRVEDKGRYAPVAQREREPAEDEENGGEFAAAPAAATAATAATAAAAAADDAGAKRSELLASADTAPELNGASLSISALGSGTSRGGSGRGRRSRSRRRKDDATASTPAATEHRIPPLLALAYFGAASAASLFIPFLVLEAGALWDSPLTRGESLFPTLSYLAFGSLLALALNISELALISQTSSLTLTVCGVSKLVALVYISQIAFGAHLEAWNQLGVLMSMAGVVAYSAIQYRRALR